MLYMLRSWCSNVELDPTKIDSKRRSTLGKFKVPARNTGRSGKGELGRERGAQPCRGPAHPDTRRLFGRSTDHTGLSSRCRSSSGIAKSEDALSPPSPTAGRPEGGQHGVRPGKRTAGLCNARGMMGTQESWTLKENFEMKVGLRK